MSKQDIGTLLDVIEYAQCAAHDFITDVDAGVKEGIYDNDAANKESVETAEGVVSATEELLEMWGQARKVRRTPFTHEDLLKLKDRETQSVVHVEGVVAITVDCLMAGIDAFNDHVSEALIGRGELLQDIQYDLVSADPINDELFFWIEGDVDLEDW